MTFNISNLYDEGCRKWWNNISWFRAKIFRKLKKLFLNVFFKIIFLRKILTVFQTVIKFYIYLHIMYLYYFYNVEINCHFSTINP